MTPQEAFTQLGVQRGPGQLLGAVCALGLNLCAGLCSELPRRRRHKVRLLLLNRLHFESATEAESALKIAGCGIEIFDSYFPPWKLLIHFLL